MADQPTYEMKKEKITDESYVSLKMLEYTIRKAREDGAKDADRVIFGHMNVDNTFTPDGEVLAVGSADDVFLIITRDADIPVL